jgi:hypothetical protein
MEACQRCCASSGKTTSSCCPLCWCVNDTSGPCPPSLSGPSTSTSWPLNMKWLPTKALPACSCPAGGPNSMAVAATLSSPAPAAARQQQAATAAACPRTASGVKLQHEWWHTCRQQLWQQLEQRCHHRPSQHNQLLRGQGRAHSGRTRAAAAAAASGSRAAAPCHSRPCSRAAARL